MLNLCYTCNMITDEYNLNDSYGYFFNLISTALKTKLDEQLKQFDITTHQFGILITVLKKENLTQRDIVKYTNSDEPSTTRVISRLETKGFIVRVTDEFDKRKRLVSLTQEGKKLLEKMLPYAKEENKKLVDSLTSEEQETFLNLLRKVASGL